ncbi:hypothetical protein CDD80_6081 [Ophiocordyceps camponoti-rufipedis]|uniref:NAD(P)-binding domain-containing protein n=1 Tax=Ophiocordyceps camponoti-rufipedis TaxID=2004952 RepID=A0A2C5ZGM8_9HYPO|nr:hypothetical protein CDD80_6081 [Ophiocordyceps camponoti-rufipedis]
MKLIVAGGTGFVATEVIRQALSHPAVTSVVALSRRETPVPPDVPPGKFTSVVCSDFEDYPDAVKREISGADACIWTIAVTPAKVFSLSWEQVCSICRDYPVAAVKALCKLPRSDSSRPIRFIYISGSNAARDPAQKPWVLGDYCVMRGDVETRVLDYARESKGAMEAVVVKPGLIQTPDSTGALTKAAQYIGCALISLPKITIADIAAALLDQAVNGIEQDTLDNDELARIGQRASKALK